MKFKKPAAKALTYAKQGDKGWNRLEVVEGSDVRPMAEVLEVDSAEGWCVRYARGADGRLLNDGGSLVEERVEGKFTIRVRT